MFNAMIVEDSRLARLELATALDSMGNIRLVAQAADLASARAVLAQQPIDLLFLDINLPDGNGFDLLAELSQAPKVIFTTAFDEFALKAFEQNAVDYLLKPYSVARLQAACDRLLPDSIDRQAAEQQATEQPLTLDSRFYVKDGQQCWLIQLAQVERFEALGNYTRVYFDQYKPMVYRSLSKVEARLPTAFFFRANRSEIVQLSSVCAVDSCSSGGLELTLQSGAKVEVSRRQAGVFREAFAL
jgi:two-component system, LytTR family, response regulator